jgi:uncharacterized membrane protein YidH (DUF202 family)
MEVPAMRNPTTPAVAHKPHALANRTVLAWHALPVVFLATWIVVTAVQAKIHSPSGEDWTGVILLTALVFGGGALLVSFGVSAAASAVILKRKIRRAAESGQVDVTRRSAMGAGSLGTILVWAAMAVLVIVVPVIVAVINHSTGTGAGG